MIDASYLESLAARLGEIEAELADPSVASNQKRFRALMTEHARLKHIRELGERYFKIASDLDGSRALLGDDELDDELRGVASEEIDTLEHQLPDAERALKIALLPPDPDEDRNIIMEIRAGTGGDEAALFAGDLYRMYSRFVERMGWKMGIIDASPASLGGYKEIILSVEGAQAYRTLRYESGGHRVQRIPATEASGRIHTSAATVAVLPEAEEVDEIAIEPDELRIDIFRSSGPGGQSVNTTDSAVRLTHLPSGITVQCQDEKSQHRNKEKAMRVLRARLLEHKRAEDSAKLADTRRTQIGSGDRSEKVRTYNFPQNRVTDHRINLTLHKLDRVMEGEIDELVNTLYERDVELQLKEELQADLSS